MLKKFLAVAIFTLMFSAQVSAMELTIIRESVGSVGQSSKGLRITGYTALYGNFLKGVAVFAEKLCFHFDLPWLTEKAKSSQNSDEIHRFCDEASRLGSSDIANTVPVYMLEGITEIYPVISDEGHEFWLLQTETGGGGSITLIGERDGEWVKYFHESYLPRRREFGGDYYYERFYTKGDAIIVEYKEHHTKEFRSVVYRWNAASQSFTEHKI